jgi:hypothetical protein
MSARALQETPAGYTSSAPARRLRGGWAPRALPASVAGRCHVRGTFPRATSRWVERAFGTQPRAEVLAMLPVQHADTFRADAFNALVWYELEPVDLFIEAATASLMGGEVSTWKALARDNFERDLGPILRPSPRAIEAGALIKRAPTAWSKIFDFGTMRVGDPHGGRTLVRVDGFEAASIAIRYSMIGTMEGLLRSAGATDIATRVLAGETSFARDFEYEIAWHG